ncbi:MAG: superoxide dismutase [Bacteroidota bacterium]|nr:superoxide dismutase [Bacteroidota bacterium]
MKNENSRRTFIKKSALFTLAGAALHVAGNAAFADGILFPEGDEFSLPALPYPAEALEPYIDTQTMQIHHGKHHQGYVDKLNIAVKEGKIGKVSLEAMLANVSKYSPAVRNNGGGHFNHSLFWKIMTPSGGGEPTGMVADAINSSFDNFAAFKEKFNAAATSRFGSGWAWLVASGGKLNIGSTPNQDNPLMDVSEFKGTPLLALDVWEHAYYLKYQNKRADYINAFWSVVNWAEVNKLLKSAK